MEATVKFVRGSMGLRETSRILDVPVVTFRRRVIGVVVHAYVATLKVAVLAVGLCDTYRYLLVQDKSCIITN